MEYIFIACTNIFLWLKELVAHPNTPSYIQAFLVFYAAYVGSNYLKKRTAERKFDLTVKVYKNCLMAIDALQRVKQPPVIFKTRKDVNESILIGKEVFLKSVAFFADSYQSTLKEEHEVFENLYDCYAEMKLFFHGKDEILKPIVNLLYVRNRIMELLEYLKLSHQLIQDLMPEYLDRPVKIAINSMVQIWEDIELDNDQKQAQDSIEQADGVKSIRKYYYLNDMINNARCEIDKVFPKLVT
jgi:hypothetical protein